MTCTIQPSGTSALLGDQPVRGLADKPEILGPTSENEAREIEVVEALLNELCLESPLADPLKRAVPDAV